MERNEANQEVIVCGRAFRRVKMGLDEEEVASFIRRLTSERDELAKHRESSASLARFIEKMAKEADEWTEQVKKEAREKANAEAKSILARAEEQAKKLIEEKRVEAVTLARKEADFLKSQAQAQTTAWLKEMKENFAIQLRGIGGLLRKEMLAQAEGLKRRAAAFEIDLERQLEDITGREIPAETVEASGNETASVGETTQPSQTAEGADENWIELHVYPPGAEGIKAVKSHLELIPQIKASQIMPQSDKSLLMVCLREPVNMVQTLMAVPEVRMVEEMEDGPDKFKVTLVVRPATDKSKSASRGEHGKFMNGGGLKEIPLTWRE